MNAFFQPSHYPSYERVKKCFLLIFQTCLLLVLGKGSLSAQDDIATLSIYCSQSNHDISISSMAEWEQHRWKIMQGLEQAMGRLPARSTSEILEVIYEDTLSTDAYLRISLRFQAALGEWVPAYLYQPKRKDVGGRSPAMIALHPTGMLGRKIVDGQGRKNRGYAKELAERGYVVIAPDYPSFGDLEHYDFETDRYESATMAGIFYHMRCVDLLCQLSDVDPARIGAIGHSLGGHNAMFLAAFDHRIKAIVASCGWTQFEYYDIGASALERFGGRLGPWAQRRYMPLLKTKFDLDGSKFPFDFHEVIALIAPRHFFSNSPVNDANFAIDGVRDGFGKAQKVYRFLDATPNIKIEYPMAEHDFPTAVRTQSYEFIDMVLDHRPSKHNVE